MSEEEVQQPSQAVAIFEAKIAEYLNSKNIGTTEDAHALALLVIELLAYHPDETGKLATDTLTPAFLTLLNLFASSYPGGNQAMEAEAIDLMKQVDKVMEEKSPAVIIFTTAEYLLNTINRTMQAMKQHVHDEVSEDDRPA